LRHCSAEGDFVYEEMTNFDIALHALRYLQHRASHRAHAARQGPGEELFHEDFA
jgi:hypothetical protein